jgi:hypothetical protein
MSKKQNHRVHKKAGEELHSGRLSGKKVDSGQDVTLQSSSKSESTEEIELKGEDRIEPAQVDVPRISEPPSIEDTKLIMAIDSTLIEIKQALIEFHSHDIEIAKLGEETRNLIGELQRELKLKAA